MKLKSGMKKKHSHISNCETICISSFVINILLTEIIIITMFNWRTRLPVVSITNNQTAMRVCTAGEPYHWCSTFYTHICIELLQSYNLSWSCEWTNGKHQVNSPFFTDIGMDHKQNDLIDQYRFRFWHVAAVLFSKIKWSFQGSVNKYQVQVKVMFITASISIIHSELNMRGNAFDVFGILWTSNLCVISIIF